MRSNSERHLPKERGTLSVICVHSGERNLLRDQEPIVCLNSGARNLHLHKLFELCENALASKRYLPEERGTLSFICVHSRERNLLRDQELIVCLNRGVRNLYIHKRVELCENALVRYYKYYKRSLLK